MAETDAPATAIGLEQLDKDWVTGRNVLSGILVDIVLSTTILLEQTDAGIVHVTPGLDVVLGGLEVLGDKEFAGQELGLAVCALDVTILFSVADQLAGGREDQADEAGFGVDADNVGGFSLGAEETESQDGEG